MTAGNNEKCWLTGVPWHLRFDILSQCLHQSRPSLTEELCWVDIPIFSQSARQKFSTHQQGMSKSRFDTWHENPHSHEAFISGSSITRNDHSLENTPIEAQIRTLDMHLLYSIVLRTSVICLKLNQLEEFSLYFLCLLCACAAPISSHKTVPTGSEIAAAAACSEDRLSVVVSRDVMSQTSHDTKKQAPSLLRQKSEIERRTRLFLWHASLDSLAHNRFRGKTLFVEVTISRRSCDNGCQVVFGLFWRNALTCCTWNMKKKHNTTTTSSAVYCRTHNLLENGFIICLGLHVIPIYWVRGGIMEVTCHPFYEFDIIDPCP